MHGNATLADGRVMVAGGYQAVGTPGYSSEHSGNLTSHKDMVRRTSFPW